MMPAESPDAWRPALPDRFIHRFIPPRDSGVATLLVLHGAGGDENSLVPLAQMIDDRAAILSPRGRVVQNGEMRFFRRIAEGVFDQADLREQTAALAGFLSEAVVSYGLDPARVYAFGYSNGANVAASLLLSVPELLAGGMLFRSLLPLDVEPQARLTGKHLFISAGRQDPLIPQASTERLVRVLEAAGASVNALWQDAGHTLAPADVREARKWWNQIGRTSTSSTHSRA